MSGVHTSIRFTAAVIRRHSQQPRRHGVTSRNVKGRQTVNSSDKCVLYVGLRQTPNLALSLMLVLHLPLRRSPAHSPPNAVEENDLEFEWPDFLNIGEVRVLKESETQTNYTVSQKMSHFVIVHIFVKY